RRARRAVIETITGVTARPVAGHATSRRRASTRDRSPVGWHADRLSSGMHRLALAIALAVAGCATTPSDPCAAAADHVAECTGAMPGPQMTTCDTDRAEQVLAMDCDELQRSGKADGWI